MECNFNAFGLHYLITHSNQHLRETRKFPVQTSLWFICQNNRLKVLVKQKNVIQQFIMQLLPLLVMKTEEI
jgi:hypothetical protein